MSEINERHYLIEIIAGKYARVARGQPVTKTKRRQKNGRQHFPKGVLGNIQNRWIIIRSSDYFDRNERLSGDDVARSELFDYSGESGKRFYNNCEKLP
jgi:hypothetical protein